MYADSLFSGELLGYMCICMPLCIEISKHDIVRRALTAYSFQPKIVLFWKTTDPNIFLVRVLVTVIGTVSTLRHTVIHQQNLGNALELIISSMSFKACWHMTTVIHSINSAWNVSAQTRREVNRLTEFRNSEPKLQNPYTSCRQAIWHRAINHLRTFKSCS